MGEKKTNKLDITILFIHNCNNDNMGKDMECMSTFSQDKYTQDIELACNIYCTQYTKTEKSTNNNGNKGNDKDWDKSYDNGNNYNEKKGELISAHISGDNDKSMDSATVILEAHASNSDMWEITVDDKISSLVDK